MYNCGCGLCISEVIVLKLNVIFTYWDLLNADYGQKPMYNAAPSMPTSYGYPGPSKKIEIPNGRVGVIIGKGGETIKYLQLQSGAKIQVTRDMDADPNSQTRAVELMGTSEQIAKAEQLISEVLAEVVICSLTSGTMLTV